MTGRQPHADVDPLFVERWSPRAFSPDPVSDEILAALFEAARWSPSAGNEQPWQFLYATRPEDLAVFRGLLDEGNRRWAADAPVLAFVCARRVRGNGKPNRWAEFDSGAAWMSLALQARQRGLFTHAMAGFDEAAAYEALGVPRDRYRIMAAIAIGRRNDPAALPEDLARRERPSDRRPLTEVAREGGFGDRG